MFMSLSNTHDCSHCALSKQQIIPLIYLLLSPKHPGSVTNVTKISLEQLIQLVVIIVQAESRLEPKKAGPKDSSLFFKIAYITSLRYIKDGLMDSLKHIN